MITEIQGGKTCNMYKLDLKDASLRKNPVMSYLKKLLNTKKNKQCTMTTQSKGRDFGDGWEVREQATASLPRAFPHQL